ncbi:MAG TPA: hypothetical protein DCO75_02240 [Fibrobacteres bacterium]|nr:hypothetical protein [Fibrobacterota bacterium]
MRYTDILYTVCAAAVIFTTGAAGETQILFDGTASYNSVEPHEKSYPYTSNGMFYNTNLSVYKGITDSVSLELHQRLNAGNREPTFNELARPVDNYIYGGLIINALGQWRAGASNELYPFAKSYPTPYILSYQTMTPQMLNAASGSWNLDGERLGLKAAATYFVYSYELKPLDPYTEYSMASAAPFGNKLDADLWTDASAGLDITDEIRVNAGTFFKRDFNDCNDYDITNFWAGFSGENTFNNNRCILSWDARERYLLSEVMSSSGYADGAITDCAARILWKKKKDFFIKGVTRIQIGRNLHKQLYEAFMRKTWDNGSSLDLCYYVTSSVLFPRHIIRITDRSMLSKRFGISPTIEAYICRVAGESAFRYSRSNLSLELLFPFKNRMEAFTGCGYKHFDRSPLFASRATVYAGLRTW